jgi:hypothetical protein
MVAPDRAMENLPETNLVLEGVPFSVICRFAAAAGELPSVGPPMVKAKTSVRLQRTRSLVETNTPTSESL